MLFDTIASLQSDEASFAFAELFHLHYEAVYRYALHKTKSEYLAEETTQLAFVKLWQYRQSLSAEWSVETQLFRIVKTTIIDLVKKNNPQSKWASHTHGTATPLTNMVWETVAERDMKQRILTGIEQMPATRKKVFQLSRFEERSNKEIAAQLSLSVKTVEYHITQALKYLKQVVTLLTLLLCLRQ